MITIEKKFKNVDNGSIDWTHWTCFYIEDHKAFYFDCFGWQHDNFLPNYLPKPIVSHKFETQGVNSKLRGKFRLRFFFLKKDGKTTMLF